MATATTSKPRSKRRLHPVAQYAADVLAGRIVAGRSVQLACQRHLDDLAKGHERGLVFDEAAADRAVGFFDFLQLSEGEFAGRPFTLQPWQVFIVGSLFGWKGADGYRRFRTAYIEVGKGNGKSPTAAAIGLYGLVADNEEGAEIYSAATTREQAGILFRDAMNMVNASPALSGRIERNVRNLAVLSTNSFFRPLSSENRGLDGKRVHMALIDEVHEHPNSTVVDKMRAGTKGRRQSMVVEITNSGYDRTSVCWDHHSYSLQVVEGTVPNDSWFAYVAGLDQGDEWTDESVWVKANPNIGVSVTLKYLREQVAEALGMPAKQNIVKRLNFCIWTQSFAQWLDMSLWDTPEAAAPFSEADLGEYPRWDFLDLASTTDLAAWVKLYRDPDGRYYIVPTFFAPEDGLRERELRDRVPYDQWVREGYIIATEGNVIDYDVIREHIRADANVPLEIGFDPWNATQIATQLMGDGYKMVQVRQGFFSLAEPTKEFGRLIKTGLIRHGGNPVMRWMASNVVVETDAAGNMKPSKAKGTGRIDGIVAAIGALSRAIVSDGGTSVYEERGMLAY